MKTSISDEKVLKAIEFVRRYREVGPIASPIFRSFTPSELQQYSGLIKLKFSVERSLIYRNLYAELFPRIPLSNIALLRGLNIYLIGKDLYTLNTRIFSPYTPTARLGMPITLGIAVRSDNGTWPPSIQDLEDAIHTLGASKEEIDQAMPLRERSAHILCCAFISLLLAGNNIVYAMLPDFSQPSYRFIWLDGSVEVLVDLQKKKKIWTSLPTIPGGMSEYSAASLLLNGGPTQYSAPISSLNLDYLKIMDLVSRSSPPPHDHGTSQIVVSKDGHYLGEEYVSFDLLDFK